MYNSEDASKNINWTIDPYFFEYILFYSFSFCRENTLHGIFTFITRELEKSPNMENFFPRLTKKTAVAFDSRLSL